MMDFTLTLARDLIRCPSVTPEDAGALGVLEEALKPLGFTCHRLPFSQEGTATVDNLYARLGTKGPLFCFAGHTDVVPVGDVAAWSCDPFGADIRDGFLMGRGASDMKGAVAAFCGAVKSFTERRGADFGGSIALLITGDEEGPAINGTRKVLNWMREHGENADFCLVGEPTNPRHMGEMAKIGRRGSLTGELTVLGAQGHVGYPHLADNPVPRLIRILDALISRRLDEGTEHFQPSNLEVTTIDIGNTASNIIPAQAFARFNIRFNTEHDCASLEDWIRGVCEDSGGAYKLDFHCSGEPFLTPPGPHSEMIADAVEAVTGRRPELSTTGGTSDARFIKDMCPVIEFGLVGESMHKVDEHCRLADLEALEAIYDGILERFFTDTAP